MAVGLFDMCGSPWNSSRGGDKILFQVRQSATNPRTFEEEKKERMEEEKKVRACVQFIVSPVQLHALLFLFCASVCLHVYRVLLFECDLACAWSSVKCSHLHDISIRCALISTSPCVCVGRSCSRLSVLLARKNTSSAEQPAF